MTEIKQTFWHPFSDMSRVGGREIVLVRGEGATLIDSAGRRYLDATAGLWFANVGHGRAEIAEAAAAQMRALAAYSTFDRYANERCLELSERLASIAPFDDCAVFLTSGGSDSVDTAAKLARRYWQLNRAPRRTLIVARSQAYHGMHVFGTSLGGIAANSAGWGSSEPDVMHVAHDDAEALAALLQAHGDRVAAFIGEPVIGAGGVIPPPDGYWPRVEKLCRAHGILLIADEVVTGYGRLGTWFASEHYGFEPDIVTTAKGLTSGYVPLGAVLVGARVRDSLWSPAAGVFRHGYTYSGHAVACAAALANLDIIEREGLLDNVRILAPILERGLEGLAAHPAVQEVRQAGLLGSVQLSPDLPPSRPQAVDRLVDRLRERGILLRGLVGHSLQLSPPFVITPAELRRIFDVLNEELSALAVGRPADA